MPRYFAIIPAAGTGARFGASRPKQYLDLNGRPLIYHTLAAQRDVTDEAGAIEAAGLQPKLVASSTSNLKVTYPADLALAALILREQASS